MAQRLSQRGEGMGSVPARRAPGRSRLQISAVAVRAREDRRTNHRLQTRHRRHGRRFLFDEGAGAEVLSRNFGRSEPRCRRTVTDTQDQLQNVNVLSSDLLATPEEIKRRMPLTRAGGEHRLRVAAGRSRDPRTRRSAPVRRRRPMLDPRRRGRPRVREPSARICRRASLRRCFRSCACISRSRARPSAGRG